MKSIFFVSTGRTGTTFLTRFFNTAVENAFSRHEPRPVFRRNKARYIKGEFKSYEKIRFRFTRQQWFNAEPEDWYVESNHHLFAAIPMIREAFPEAVIIHVIRDGRDVVTSWLNRYRYITNNNLPAEDIGDKEAVQLWESWNPLQRTTWLWKTVNTHTRKSKPDLTIRFEDIFTESPEDSVIFPLLDRFEGMSYNHKEVCRMLTRKVNTNKQDFFPYYKEWPSFWKSQFWEIAEEEMAFYGYNRKENALCPVMRLNEQVYSEIL